MLWADFLRPVWEPMIEATDELFNMLGDKLGEISDFVFTVWEGVRTDTERFWGQIIAIIDKGVKDRDKWYGYIHEPANSRKIEYPQSTPTGN
ncbi:hypothetical protein LCGC14_3086490 [marine sediment metagenome]|uniref:Uncharacterized protein n=1 Tax=marine sediment metagenome TaxID=412755 RepID=A0A0F8YJA7_9ZZZZ